MVMCTTTGNLRERFVKRPRQTSISPSVLNSVPNIRTEVLGECCGETRGCGVVCCRNGVQNCKVRCEG